MSNVLKQYPKVVDDFSCWEYWEKDNKKVYALGSIEVDKYIMIEEENVNIIVETVKLMNGNNSSAQIQEEIKNRHKADIDVEQLVAKLKKSGLVISDDLNIKKGELDTFAKTLLLFNFKKISGKKRTILSGLWNVIAIMFFMAIFVTVFIISFNFNSFKNFYSQGFIYQNSYIKGLILAAFISIFNIIIHESAHALTAVRFKLQPSEFKMLLYGGFKLLWMVRIKGIYTVPRKIRILIMSSGMLSNLFLMSLAFILGNQFKANLEFTQLVAKVFITNLFMIIACSVPFNISDGYYIVTQILKRSNLRLQMFKMLNFRKGTSEKYDIVNFIYLIISTGFIVYSFYLMGVWAVNISKELYMAINTNVLNYIVASLPVLFAVWIMFVFITRFVKLVKQN